MSGYGKPCQWSYLVSNQRFTSFGKLVEFQPVVTFSQGSYFQPIKPEDNTMHDLQQMSRTMRQEFEGEGKGGITEVRVNAMAARGRRELKESLSAVLPRAFLTTPLPFSLLVETSATQATIQGCQPANFSSTWCNYRLFRKRAVWERERDERVSKKGREPFLPFLLALPNILTRPYPLPFTPFQMLDTGYKSGGWTNKT